jgi:hypothetical protein
MQVIVLAFLSIISFHGAVVSANAAHAVAQEDRAVIQRRRVVLVRRGQLAKEFPHKRRAIVTYPIVSGLRDPQVLRRVRSLLELKNIFDYSLKEYTEDAWLSEFGYVVNYNGNSLLDITFTQSGSGAYPDDQEKHFLINLRDGSLVKASDAFEFGKLASLAAAVDRRLQQELREIAAENARDNSSDAEEKEAIKQAHENLKFEISNLDEFSVGRKGITFLYDAGFPHVIQALEPAGRYLFTYAELKPYIKPGGPLGQFVR